MRDVGVAIIYVPQIRRSTSSTISNGFRMHDLKFKLILINKSNRHSKTPAGIIIFLEKHEMKKF